jgi:hypothetical protein
MFSVPSTFENTYYDIGTRFVKGIKGLRWINNYRVLLLSIGIPLICVLKKGAAIFFQHPFKSSMVSHCGVVKYLWSSI